eukprot:m51a1_g8315 hypothetical protein (415) ;mRNA; f:99275-100854
MRAAERPLRSLSFQLCGPAAPPVKCGITLRLGIRTPAKGKDLRVALQAHLTELLDREVSFSRMAVHLPTALAHYASAGDALDPARDLGDDFFEQQAPLRVELLEHSLQCSPPRADPRRRLVALKSIELERCAMFRSVRVDLAGTASVLVGECESGKTTVLRAINVLLFCVHSHVQSGAKAFKLERHKLAPPGAKGFVALFHNYDVSQPLGLRGTFSTEATDTTASFSFTCRLGFDFDLDVTVGVGDSPSDYSAAFAVPLFFDNDLSAIGVSMVPDDVVPSTLRPRGRLHTFLPNLFRFLSASSNSPERHRAVNDWVRAMFPDHEAFSLDKVAALAFVLEEFHDKDVVLIVDELEAFVGPRLLQSLVQSIVRGINHINPAFTPKIQLITSTHSPSVLTQLGSVQVSLWWSAHSNH